MSGLEVTMMKRIGELNAEVKYLQDKVERLTAEVSYDKRVQLYVDKLAAEFTQSEVERLQAEVERLIYVGDMLATMVGHCEVTGDAHRMMLELSDEWNAAKEGKQS